MWTDVQKPNLTNMRMSISKKVTWEGEIVQVKVATIGVLKEKGKGILTMGPQQGDIINKPEPKVIFRVFYSHGCALNLKVRIY